MVKTCAVAVCKNSRKKSNGVIFHKFPKEPCIRKIWVKRCHRADGFKYNNAIICSDHFCPEDYTRDFQSELLQIPTRKKLMPRAVPSLYLTPADMLCKNQEKDGKTTNSENYFTGCAIFGCKNFEISCILPGIKLFRFPEDQSISKHWMNACKRKFLNLNDAFICSVHFKKEDFAATKLLNKKLKPNAIPTLKLPAKKKQNTSSLLSDEKADTKHVEIIIDSPNKKNKTVSILKRPLLSREERAAKRANSKFVEEILREYDKKLELERCNSLNSISQKIRDLEQKNTNNLEQKNSNNLEQKNSNNLQQKNTNNLEQTNVNNSEKNTTTQTNKNEIQNSHINLEQNLSIEENNLLPLSHLDWKQQLVNAQQEIATLKEENLALLKKDAFYWKKQITGLKDENKLLKQDLTSKINKEKQKFESMWKMRLEKVRKSKTLLKRQVIALKKTNRDLKKNSDNWLFSKDESEPDKSFTEVEFNTRDSKPTKFVYWSVNDVPTAITTLKEIEKTFYLDNV